MRIFGLLADSNCKENIRKYMAGLSTEDFGALMRAETSGWSEHMRLHGRPSREDLKDFEAALHKITPAIFDGYNQDEEYELLAHLFAATNDRYLANK